MDALQEAVDHASPTSHLVPSDAALFLDRDLSLVRFQRRVFEEAQDPRNPLLERVKFLAILGANLDDFAVVRGPKLQADPDKRRAVDTAVSRLLRDANVYWQRHLAPALAAAGLHIVPYGELTETERDEVNDQFARTMSSRPKLKCDVLQHFPGAAGRGLNLAVVMRGRQGEPQFGVVHADETMPSLLPFHWRREAASRAESGTGTPEVERGYVWLDQVLEAHVASLFPNTEPISCHRFRMMREVDVPVGDEHFDPLQRVDELLGHRRTSPVVVLAVDRSMPAALQHALGDHLHVPRSGIRAVRSVSDLQRLWALTRAPRPELRDAELEGRLPARLLGRTNLFDAIRERDILLHHPYESFQPVLDLVLQAGADPDVLSISMSIYRTDRESEIGRALLAALRRGKQVRVIVELTARFDEERNAVWARTLEQAGAQVVYGTPGLKVHAKMTLISRREGAEVRRYVHVSSGNYNAFTSRIYSDLGLLTCDDDIAADVADVFDLISGRPEGLRHDASGAPCFRRLIVSPFTLRRTFGELVEREIAWSRRGELGHIILKMNALSDRDIIRLLYRASQAGVNVDLIVRGICCLRPGLPGISDHITVSSIVGQFLEHSRTWYFRNGGREQAFMGSADLMPRNLDRRVEVVAPLTDLALVRRIKQEILDQYLADNVKARRLSSDGTYSRVIASADELPVASQTALLDARQDDPLTHCA